jgi:hypothetical protein
LLGVSVGKDLIEGTIDMKFEEIEDIILLIIQQTSISVIWKHAMRWIDGQNGSNIFQLFQLLILQAFALTGKIAHSDIVLHLL